MDSEITLRMENWRGVDWDETQETHGAHVMRSKRLRNAKQGNHLKTECHIYRSYLGHLTQNHTLFKTRMK